MSTNLLPNAEQTLVKFKIMNKRMFHTIPWWLLAGGFDGQGVAEPISSTQAHRSGFQGSISINNPRDEW